MNERQESLNKIRKAYENKELGFQKGATMCMYYCSKTDSHCAVGVLIGKDEELMSRYGDIASPFKDTYMVKISDAMNHKGISEFKGLNISELEELQYHHDNLIGAWKENKDKYEKRFKEYLYSLT